MIFVVLLAAAMGVGCPRGSTEILFPNMLSTMSKSPLGFLSVNLAKTEGAASVPRTETIAPRIEELVFASASLGREMRCLVIRPVAGREGAPILYLLHGRGRNRRSLIDEATSQAALLAAGYWIVFPEGEDGWYSDTPGGRYASYLGELVQTVEQFYGLSLTLRHRAIAGWSMGGFGAVRYAETHAEQFGTVAAIIGLLDFPRPATLPEGQNYPVPVERFGSDPTGWSKYNPLGDAAQLRGKAVLIITGTEAFDRTMNEHFSAALDAAGVPHEYRLVSGGHTFSVVQTALPLVLDFVSHATR